MKPNQFVINAGDQNFTQEVLKADGPVLVDFWAPWCPPCKALSPMIESLAQQFQGRAKVVKVNVDENDGSAARYNIKALPTLVLFNDGQEVERQVGIPANPQQSLSALLDGQLHQGCACAH